MKRCWFGLVLLVVLFLVCLAATRYLAHIHEPMVKDISQAAVRSLEGDWGNADHLLRKVRSEWEQGWALTAALSDHQPMEKINTLFCQLEVAAALRDGSGFASLCARLSAELDAMGDAHTMVWWNLL